MLDNEQCDDRTIRLLFVSLVLLWCWYHLGAEYPGNSEEEDPQDGDLQGSPEEEDPKDSDMPGRDPQRRKTQLKRLQKAVTEFEEWGKDWFGKARLLRAVTWELKSELDDEDNRKVAAAIGPGAKSKKDGIIAGVLDVVLDPVDQSDRHELISSLLLEFFGIEKDKENIRSQLYERRRRGTHANQAAVVETTLDSQEEYLSGLKALWPGIDTKLTRAEAMLESMILERGFFEKVLPPEYAELQSTPAIESYHGGNRGSEPGVSHRSDFFRIGRMAQYQGVVENQKAVAAGEVPIEWVARVITCGPGGMIQRFAEHFMTNEDDAGYWFEQVEQAGLVIPDAQKVYFEQEVRSFMDDSFTKALEAENK